MHHIKYIPFILVGITFLWVAYRIITVSHLREWFLKSLETDGKPDGKKIAGLTCVNSLLAGFFITIYYDKNHAPQEFYVYTIAALIGSFYGIREVGRFIDKKYNNNGTTNPQPPVDQQQNKEEGSEQKTN